MDLDASAVWDFAGEIVGTITQRKGKTLATVTRIDNDGTAWVTTDGEGEAPASTSAVGVQVGDTVALEWDGATMGISSNVSSPAPSGGTFAAVTERAQSVASAAQKVANAVNQHFFSDSSGIHVTQLTQDEWDAQHTGPNVLINSLGQLFRDGLNNLLTLTTENNARALTIWDGLGNTAANVLATFSANGIRFADGTSFDIGDSSAYINFDGNGHISIGGNGLTIGGYATDDDVADAIDGISVGGRNLLTGSGDWSDISTSSTNPGTVSGDTFTFSSHASLAWYGVHLSYPHMPFSDVDGKTLTLSFDYRSDNFSDTTGDHYIYINAAASATIDGGRSKYRQLSTDAFNGVYVPTTAWQRGTITFDLSESLLTSGSGACNYFYIQFYNHTVNSLQLRHVKLEVGNVATDWAPAPEDVQAAVSEAAKTATNYITADLTGIKIHMSGNSTTYQHQSSAATTYYVSGNKRTEVSADGLETFDGTYGSEVSTASFGSTARIGKAAGAHITVGSSDVVMSDGSTDIVTIEANGSNMYYDRLSKIGIGGTHNAYLLLGTSSSTADGMAELSGGFGNSISVNQWDGVTTYDGIGTTSEVQLVADAIVTTDENDNTVGHPMSHLEHAVSTYMTHGSVDQSISAAANAVTTYPSSGYVSFGHTYTSAPDVVVSFYSTSTAAGFGGLTIAVSEVTTTGFKVKIFNNTSTARTPGFHWIAIG